MRDRLDHLPQPMRQELRRLTAILIEGFGDALPRNFATGRILKLILHGPHARPDWSTIAPGAAIHLLAIINDPRLARKQQVWGLVRDQLRRAWEFGEIAYPVRLAVYSLEQVNRELAQGVPHFVTATFEGIVLHEVDGTSLKPPRRLSAPERRARAQAEYGRWHGRASDFLTGAAFYDARDNAPMAALMLHQACEHLYHCVVWTMTLYGPRTHALDQLREDAEALDARLCTAWPRDTPFERRAFGCIRRAYVEVRYGDSFRISPEELAWAMERTATLHTLVTQICGEEPSPSANTPCPASPIIHGDHHVS